MNGEIGNTGLKTGQICRISVDGTDFQTMEPRPFDRMWYSHKFHGPGVHYEIGICIRTCWIVWVNGPFKCGKWPDLKIARLALFEELDEGKKVVADKGYCSHKNCAITPNQITGQSLIFHSQIRARHEIINRRFKQWRALTTTF